MHEPRVTVVILNYRRWRETAECIRSLEQCTYNNLDVLVVDNASPDDSEVRLREMFPSIEIIQAGRNLGYTGGVNFGIRSAVTRRPDYVLLLNEDTLVEPEFLTELVRAVEDDTAAAAACGTIYHHPETSQLWYAGGRIVPWRGLAVHWTSLPRNGLGSPKVLPQRVTFVTGCAMLLRTSVIETIGLKDERYFMSLEDIEYSARILHHGFQLLYVPSAVIYHRIPVKYETCFNLYYSVRNRLLFINNSLAFPHRIIARIYFLAVISVKLILWWLVRRDFYSAARMGLEDYFAGRFHEGRGVTAFSR